MTLDQYLTSGEVTASEFAAKVGVTEASISRIRKGTQNITRDLMAKIISASNGKVTADELVKAAA